MSRVIDLTRRGAVPAARISLHHPAGVVLPFEPPGDADLLGPETRGAILSGRYAAGMLDVVSCAVRPGDRVLIVGAGLGVVSTRIAQHREVWRVLALESDRRVGAYLERVHAANGVPRVEVVNATPSSGRDAQNPEPQAPEAGDGARRALFAQRGAERRSGTLAPPVDLNLIIAEEEIGLVVWDSSAYPVALLAEVDLRPVQRIAVAALAGPGAPSGEPDIDILLARRGFGAEAGGSAVLYDRASARARRARPTQDLQVRTGT